MGQLPRVTMVIGGAASGKSDFAERLVIDSKLPRAYIATAQAFDDEMRMKIDRHRKTRSGFGWHTIEEPVDLPKALSLVPSNSATLLDCATLWLSNLLLSEADIEKASDQVFALLEQRAEPIVIVTNELGHGIVPENKVAREFVQIQGRFNQRLAHQADLVVQVTAGLPLVLKGQMPEAGG